MSRLMLFGTGTNGWMWKVCVDMVLGLEGTGVCGGLVERVFVVRGEVLETC